MPFKYWVVLPRITRKEWWTCARAADAFCPPESSFAEDSQSVHLCRAPLSTLVRNSLPTPAFDAALPIKLQWCQRAFGDSSVLYHKPEDREPRKVAEGLLGEWFDELAQKSIRACRMTNNVFRNRSGKKGCG